MKTLLIGDTHGYHRQLNIADDVQMIVHSGDFTNHYNSIENEIEFNDFIEWYSEVDVQYKLLCAGNHDRTLLKKYAKDKCKDLGIIYLEHEYVQIEGRLIFGSPYTPTFGDWFFNIDRSKLYKYWDVLIEQTDLVFTHGMPYGILDVTEDRNRLNQLVGDKALLKKLLQVQPTYYSGGHIHDDKAILNYGTRTVDNCNTIFHNSALVKDRCFDLGLIHQGHIIDL